MRLILVRHGETIAGVNKILEGHLPGTLTDDGIEQSERAGVFLRDEKIGVAYCSDLKRCKETLRQIIKFHVGTPVNFTPLLRERSLGIFEGSSRRLLDDFLKKRNLNLLTFKPDNGESIAEVQTRTRDFYQDMLMKHSNDTVLWVTHSNVIASILLYVKGLGNECYEEVRPEYVSVSIIESGHPDKVIVENDVSFL